MTKICITTERLELIAGTLEIAQAEISDRSKFSKLLDARVPDTWPPEFNDLETMSFSLRKLESAPDQVGWWVWYFVLNNQATKERILIGNGGLKGQPTSDGTVEVGYSVLQEFQNVGYGTEAIKALVSWAFKHPEVQRVIAETLPELKSSQRLLEKCQFTNIGQGSEEGSIRFERSRSY
ncbi:MAG: GNAT family N-acetyltransferase [Coleofasciculus sp. C3-bin4]|nr:GNAT family N-acetyltransferase [Coleofasciculus sp. C3-bin4]